MALDLLSIPPMSAECERLFSFAGQTVSPQRESVGGQYYMTWMRRPVRDTISRHLAGPFKLNKWIGAQVVTLDDEEKLVIASLPLRATTRFKT
ncbi:Uncharacterized protein TPAR_00656 [Tolypocladium paradoxum]|uniref:HAT C-terminal dimerisation domain-containing protein n=1 Tax=Tolypocladium paradoxum TaxID=94208 RepID=A0A2S4L9M4_9HYPO|nr:Uncharacterized protein TPAR_00656 [Tolypocladium paradoxum]